MMAALAELSQELEQREGQLQQAHAALDATRQRRRATEDVSMPGEALGSIPEVEAAEEAPESERTRLERCDSVSILSQLGGLFSVLDFSNKMAMMLLAPSKLLKAGSVIKNMEKAGFEDDDINKVVRALFIEQGQDQMKLAFEVFDKEDTGCLLAKDFRPMLMLLGEEVPEEQASDLRLNSNLT